MSEAETIAELKSLAEFHDGQAAHYARVADGERALRIEAEKQANWANGRLLSAIVVIVILSVLLAIK